MNDDFHIGFFVGIVCGAVVVALFASYLRDRGRFECNINLPRSEECIQVWVPPLKELK